MKSGIFRLKFSLSSCGFCRSKNLSAWAAPTPRRLIARLLAATNRDLEKMIVAREFRSDLYYRLNVFPIRIPPLRERKEDIPMLVRNFVQKFARRMQKHTETIPATAMKTLTNWDWPGNIRELENFIEQKSRNPHPRQRQLEVPISELRKSRGLFRGPDNNGRKTRFPGLWKETIGELRKGMTRNAAKEHDRERSAGDHACSGETKGRVGGADGAAARMAINRTTLISRSEKVGA